MKLDLREFKPIPNFKRYMINRNGDVIAVARQRKLQLSEEGKCSRRRNDE